MLSWAKKFWWVLVLGVVLSYFGIKAYLRAVARANAIERQLKREAELNHDLRTSAKYRIEERRRIHEEIRAGRHDLETRKHELEVLAKDDDNVVADYWNRVFGGPRGGPSNPTE
jgi:uncharacterized protein HemX